MAIRSMVGLLFGALITLFVPTLYSILFSVEFNGCEFMKRCAIHSSRGGSDLRDMCRYHAA